VARGETVAAHKEGAIVLQNAELSSKKLAILSFHKIGEPPRGAWSTWFYIPEDTFIRQLTYLATNGWEVIDQSRFVKGLEDAESLPRRSALITFDDGYRSMRTVALPLLRRFGFPPFFLFRRTISEGATRLIREVSRTNPSAIGMI